MFVIEDYVDSTEAPHLQRVDPADFRSALSHFASGVVVLTGLNAEGAPVGMTAQSFVSLSLDPPLILVCPARRATTWPTITGRKFAVNILAAQQRDLSAAFSRRGVDRFADIDWHNGPYGLPLLDGAIAHIECDLEASHPGGDHHIVIGRVRTLETLADANPLLYFRSGYWVTAPHPEVVEE